MCQRVWALYKDLCVYQVHIMTILSEKSVSYNIESYFMLEILQFLGFFFNYIFWFIYVYFKYTIDSYNYNDAL